MRLLLDTHAVIWAVEQPAQLSPNARSALEDTSNQIVISAATVWEIAIKVGLGRLSLSMPYREWMNRALADLGATLLPITVEYAAAQATLPNHHGDPFDRMLIAQARVDNLPLVSSDNALDQYGISRVW